MVFMTTSVTAIALPLINLIYDPTRPYMINKRRNIQHNPPNAELRIVLSIHDEESVPGFISLLESLAELILSTRQFLNEQADECLLLRAYPMYFDLQITSTSRIYFISRLQPLTRQIEDHSSVISPAERMGVQSNALSGSSFAELGSFAARAWSYNNET